MMYITPITRAWELAMLNDDIMVYCAQLCSGLGVRWLAGQGGGVWPPGGGGLPQQARRESLDCAELEHLTCFPSLATSDHTYWTRGYHAPSHCTPAFLEQYSDVILTSGKALNLLRLCCPSVRRLLPSRLAASARRCLSLPLSTPSAALMAGHPTSVWLPPCTSCRRSSSSVR